MAAVHWCGRARDQSNQQGLGLGHDSRISPCRHDRGARLHDLDRFRCCGVVSVIRRLTLGSLALGFAIAVVFGFGAGVPARAVEDRVLCEITDTRLTEISGMTASALHPNVMWVHNDSGDVARLYALNITTCEVVAELTLRNVEARDFEGIARGVDRKGRAVLWVGDIGDNLDSWESVAIYRVREPAKLNSRTIRSVEYRFTYEDRPHNAETILADPNSPQLWIVTKQLASGSIYKLPERLSKSSINIAARVGRVGGLVTDGSMHPNGSGFVLRDYFDAHVYGGLPPGELLETFALPAQIQGEAIALTADGESLVIASEKDTRLIQVNLPELDQPDDLPPSDPQPSDPQRSDPQIDQSDSTANESINYVPLGIGVIGGIALVTGLIIMSRKPRDRATGKTINAE